ncbi:33899_t:CDS:1, partial [Racocetra persica]
STKKVKKSDEKKDSNVVKKLIDELSIETSQISEVNEESTGNFHDLYLAINRAEEQSEHVNQLVIKSYYDFGKAFEERYEYYRKNNPKRTAQALVNKEVGKQLPESVSETSLRKRKERAQKIYELFSEIGVGRIQRVKSFTALMISKLSQDDIDVILVHFAQHQDTSET